MNKNIINFQYFFAFVSVAINVLAMFLVSMSLSDAFDLQIKNIDIPVIHNRFLKLVIDSTLSTVNFGINLTNTLPVLPLVIFLTLIGLSIIIKLYTLRDDYSVGIWPRIFSNFITGISSIFIFKYITFSSNSTVLDLKIFKIVKEPDINFKKLEFEKSYNSEIENLCNLKLDLVNNFINKEEVLAYLRRRFESINSLDDAYFKTNNKTDLILKGQELANSYFNSYLTEIYQSKILQEKILVEIIEQTKNLIPIKEVTIMTNAAYYMPIIQTALYILGISGFVLVSYLLIRQVIDSGITKDIVSQLNGSNLKSAQHYQEFIEFRNETDASVKLIQEAVVEINQQLPNVVTKVMHDLAGNTGIATDIAIAELTNRLDDHTDIIDSLPNMIQAIRLDMGLLRRVLCEAGTEVPKLMSSPEDLQSIAEAVLASIQ